MHDARPSTVTPPSAATLFVASDLSRSSWVVAVHAPHAGKVSRHTTEHTANIRPNSDYGGAESGLFRRETLVARSTFVYVHLQNLVDLLFAWRMAVEFRVPLLDFCPNVEIKG